MSHRFFCSPLIEVGTVVLADAEAHHLQHVLRHQVGDIVELFDGAGLRATSRITAIRKRDVELEVIASAVTAPPQTRLTLATAVPKGDRFDWLIEKATELGVSRLIPLTTLRSVVDPRASKLDKLRQTVITACKQSGRNHLMTISPVMSWRDFLQEFGAPCPIFVAHPNGTPVDTVLAESVEPNRTLAAAIGPEGGFSEEEIQMATESGANPVRLGPNILRIETAAIALAAKLLL